MGVTILKTFSLAGVGEGWTDDCRITYKVPSYAQRKAIRDDESISKDMGEAAANDLLVQLIADQFVSGKCMDLNENNELVLVDMTKDSVEQLTPEILGKIFNDMNGGGLDPKGIQSEAQSEQPLQPSDSPTMTS